MRMIPQIGIPSTEISNSPSAKRKKWLRFVGLCHLCHCPPMMAGTNDTKAENLKYDYKTLSLATNEAIDHKIYALSGI